jgi:hypothetical protein
LVETERVKLIENLFSEAVTYMEKGDAIQSSEKLYKAAEESIKALAKQFDLEEFKASEEEGRWTVTLLEKAVGKLVERLGMDVEQAWDSANYLHIWGFHETRLDAEDVKRRILIIRRLVELTKKV